MAKGIRNRIAPLLLVFGMLLAPASIAHAAQSDAGWSFSDDGTLALTSAGGLNAVPLSFDLMQVTALYIDQSVKSVQLSEKRPRLLPEHIEVSHANPYFAVNDGLLIDQRKNQIVCAQNGFSRIAIPNSIRAIGAYAFAGHGALISVHFPETLQEIGDGAFEACDGLENALLPANATLGARVFADCRALTEAAYRDGAAETGVATFENCILLENVQLPESIRVIDTRAFYGCERLQIGRVPRSLQAINASAFAGCWSLDRIALSAAVTVAPDALPYAIKPTSPQAQSGEGWSFSPDGTLTLTSADGVAAVPLDFLWDEVRQLRLSKAVAEVFLCEDIPWLLPQTIWVHPGNPFFTVVNGMLIRREDAAVVCAEEGITHAVVPAGVAAIDLCAFSRHAKLESVELPETLRTIGEGGFEACESLTSILLPEQLESVGTWAFHDCGALTEVTIPAGTNLYADAFDGCVSLKSVRYAEGAVETGPGAFSNCTALTDVALPDTLQTISERSFENCARLETLVLPRGLSAIASHAFRGCTSLMPLDIPDTAEVAPDALPYAPPLPASPVVTADVPLPAITPAPDKEAEDRADMHIPAWIGSIGVIVAAAAIGIIAAWRRKKHAQ